MFPKQNLERNLNVQIATSGVMDNAISLWLQMYENKPPWLGGEEDIKSMNLPAAIAEEFARLILTEFEFNLEGSARAEFLNQQFENYLNNFDNIIEMWGALGGIAIKPYVSGTDPVTGKPDRIQLDFVQANRFYPTAFNSNKEITGAVFIDTQRVGDYLYTRLEHHNLENDHYTVVNKAYRSERLNTMTTEDDQISVEHPFMQEVPLETMGEKTRIIHTDDGRNAEMYAYETASPTFGDIGTGKIDNDGYCYVYLENDFLATIEKNMKYHVTLTAKGPGELYIESTNENDGYFLVKGTPKLEFYWEVRVRQKGCRDTRIEESNIPEKEDVTAEDQEMINEQIRNQAILLCEMEKDENEVRDEQSNLIERMEELS